MENNKKKVDKLLARLDSEFPEPREIPPDFDNPYDLCYIGIYLCGVNGLPREEVVFAEHACHLMEIGWPVDVSIRRWWTDDPFVGDYYVQEWGNVFDTFAEEYVDCLPEDHAIRIFLDKCMFAKVPSELHDSRYEPELKKRGIDISGLPRLREEPPRPPTSPRRTFETRNPFDCLEDE